MGEARSSADNVVAVDAYALVQALLGRQGEKVKSESDRSEALEYDDLPDLRSDMRLSGGGQGPKPDDQPKDVRVGCANPYALVEAILGRRIDRQSVNAATLISQVLQTDYDELFDLRNKSVLYAGLQLNEKERTARQLTQKDIQILREQDLITPDLSRVRRLGDLEQIGLKDIGNLRIKHSRMQNGKIRLTVQANSNGNQVAKTVSNREVTMTLNELLTPFRLNRGGGDNEGRKGEWTPPNASWRDMHDHYFQSVNRRFISDVTNFSIGDGRRITHPVFDDPTQGASTNSWFVAALFSVFWADPASINRATRVHRQREHSGGPDGDHNRHRHTLRVRFHDKGGDNNGRDETVEVDYEIPVTNSSGEPVFARASDGTDIWPSLYEKAFAKWISSSSSDGQQRRGGGDHPDLTVTHSGDPVKAMAQLNGREPQYFRCENHSPEDLIGVVRSNCVNNRTINPMACWTHATGPMYRGSNMVANHAYSVCGYAIVGDRQYIVLRNPFGVTEAAGLTSYSGLLNRMDPELWQPAELLDQGGLFALEMEAFKKSFQYMGVAK